MRLIRTSDHSHVQYQADQIPRYAILSHRWQQPDSELTLEDLESGYCSQQKRQGLRKIEQACHIAIKHGCEWLWVDTCCIDKRDPNELQEAINSMFMWYRNSHVCIAYLSDHTHGLSRLSDSSWWERCWTLQELIAPRNVSFYDSKWSWIDSKQGLCDDIAQITGIPESILRGGDLEQCSIAQRMSWAANRKATRIEDQAYSLLGIFGLTMPTVYGGNSQQAFQTLQEKLIQGHDHSILTWTRHIDTPTPEYKGLLAESPADFRSCRRTKKMESPIRSVTVIKGHGVELDLDTIPYSCGVYLCALKCTTTTSDRYDAILLQQLDSPQHYARILTESTSAVSISKKEFEKNNARKQRTLFVYHHPRYPPLKLIRGILIKRFDLIDEYKSSHDKIRILSRRDGRLSTSDTRPIVQLPASEWGTAGLIYFPPDQRNFRHWSVDWIKLAFDADFHPVISLGFSKNAVTDVSLGTKHPPPRGTDDYDHLWRSHWICKELPRKMKTVYISRSKGSTIRAPERREEEYTNAEYFYHRRSEQHTATTPAGLHFYRYHLGLDIKLTLEDHEGDERPPHLSVPGPGPWKVWTLTIMEDRNFEKEVRRRNRMLALAGAAVLGFGGALAYRDAHGDGDGNNDEDGIERRQSI